VCARRWSRKLNVHKLIPEYKIDYFSLILLPTLVQTQLWHHSHIKPDEVSHSVDEPTEEPH
jgi:hypothetical protein